MSHERLLADRIIEFSTHYRGPKVLRDDFVHVAGKIMKAQRFVVSDDVRGAIRSLLMSKPSTLVEAARFARLPFERCWFEWFPPAEANLHEGQLPVRKCGAMLEQYGPHGFTLFTAWEFDKEAMRAEMMREVERQRPGWDGEIDYSLIPAFGVSALVGVYDLSSMVLPPLWKQDSQHKWFQQRDLTLDDLAKERDDGRNGAKWAFKDPSEWEALKSLSMRSGFRVHEETHGDFKIGEQMRQQGSAASILHDVQDEMGHLFATLILMNAKNCVEVAKSEPPEKLNKARRKQGKAELLPYSTVHIELTKSQQRAVASGAISREEARRHLVRGHFKVRAGGVFWWSNFMRGNAARGTLGRSAHVIQSKEAANG